MESILRCELHRVLFSKRRKLLSEQNMELARVGFLATHGVVAVGRVPQSLQPDFIRAVLRAFTRGDCSDDGRVSRTHSPCFVQAVPVQTSVL